MNYEWQDKAILRYARAAYFALIVDCGCGKTLAAIKIALIKHLPTLVIAPGHTLCSQWENDIREIAGAEADVWRYDRKKEAKLGDDYYRAFISWLKDGSDGKKYT